MATQHFNNNESSRAMVVADIIRSLMKECCVIEAELARQTNLPQTTINRLLSGETLDPRSNTLIPIAKFFGVTVGQLLGQEPISPHRVSGTFSATNRSAWSLIPIITWEEAKSWFFSKGKITPNNQTNWIATEKNIGENSFALKTTISMEPRFRKNSVIIVDPDVKPVDGSFVVILITSSNVPTVRRVLKDGDETLLGKIYGNENPTRLSSTDTILGTLVETRITEK